MPRLRLNEHYVSVQGEGPNVGEPTQFIRFSGCNLRCPGWPCDTQHAIQPALYKNDPRPDPNEILDAANLHRASTGANRICITGGEPFLQDNVLLRAVVTYLLHNDFTVDLFTNGTLPFDTWVVNSKVTVCMDWKLKGSGEGHFRIATRLENYTLLREKDAVKFVVKDFDDLWEAKAVFEDLVTSHIGPRFYVGAVWGSITDIEIVDFIMQHQLPWWLNVQVHKHIWEESTRGV